MNDSEAFEKNMQQVRADASSGDNPLPFLIVFNYEELRFSLYFVYMYLNNL